MRLGRIHREPRQVHRRPASEAEAVAAGLEPAERGLDRGEKATLPASDLPALAGRHAPANEAPPPGSERQGP